MTRITPIRFTADVARLAAFYALLGLSEKTSETSRTWTFLDGSGGGLGLHIAADTDAATRPVSLQVTVDDDTLDELHDALSRNDHVPGPIVDETFGRYFLVTDPDGQVLQVNETPLEFSRPYETTAG